MPHNKQGRTQVLQRGMALPQFGEQQRVREQLSFSYCCVPRGCDRYRDDPIMHEDPMDAVRVLCNNEQCSEGNWMHADCFQEWEQQVLSFLRSCGRARSWSEKQRLQNLWTKKGYDLVYKACDCKCGKGHLRKDTDYRQNLMLANQKNKANRAAKIQQHKNSVPSKPMPVIGRAIGPGFVGMRSNGSGHSQSSSNGSLGVGAFLSNAGINASQHHNGHLGQINGSMRPQLRIRTNSLSSTGSSCSPPSSAGTPPQTPGGTIVAGCKKKFDFFASQEQAAAGNIFQRRTDYSVFGMLPRYQQNPYHIKMEDEGPHGNDETRCFVLTNLSTHGVTQVNCVICSIALPVFDKYPLIDGTFFLSPQRYNTDLQVLNDHKMLYLNAVCMKCLQPPHPQRSIKCIACRRPWYGSAFVIGSMYAYDVFAALPCCAARFSCKNCRTPILDPGCAFQFFSEYSKIMKCPHCKVEDHHFIKPLEQVFTRMN